MLVYDFALESIFQCVMTRMCRFSAVRMYRLLSVAIQIWLSIISVILRRPPGDFCVLCYA